MKRIVPQKSSFNTSTGLGTCSHVLHRKRFSNHSQLSLFKVKGVPPLRSGVRGRKGNRDGNYHWTPLTELHCLLRKVTGKVVRSARINDSTHRKYAAQLLAAPIELISGIAEHDLDQFP